MNNTENSSKIKLKKSTGDQPVPLDLGEVVLFILMLSIRFYIHSA